MNQISIDGTQYTPYIKYGKMTLLVYPGEKLLKARPHYFQCDCGKIKKVRLAHVVSGITVSCGCAKLKNVPLVGQKSGRLTVISRDLVPVGHVNRVMCRCECGTEKLVGTFEIINQTTKSCGCLVVEQVKALSYKHGGEGTPLYTCWHAMKMRCLNPNVDHFHRYGGRGISVYSEWMEFIPFRDWALSAGYDPKLQIDRIDVDGNYEPDNCRFVTAKVNGNNRGNNVVLTAFGESKTMSDWSDDPRCMVSYECLQQRILKKKQWTHEEAMTKPLFARY